jgi:hypothetical protein
MCRGGVPPSGMAFRHSFMKIRPLVKKLSECEGGRQKGHDFTINVYLHF